MRRTVKFNLLLSEEEKRRLVLLALDDGRSSAGFLRRMIRERYEAHAPTKPSALSQVRKQVPRS